MWKRRLRQIDASSLMKAYRQAQLLALRPEWIVIGVAPFSFVDVIGAQENSAKAVVIHRAAYFFNGSADVVRRNHGDAVHALRIGSGEIIKPVVVSARDCRGEVGVEIVDAESGEPARRKQDRDVEAFLVHRLDLRYAIEVSFARLSVFFRKEVLTVFGQSGIFRLARNRHDLAFDFNAEIAKRAVESLGRALEVFPIDVALPQVGRFEHVHVGVHRLESVLGHFFFSSSAFRLRLLHRGQVFQFFFHLGRDRQNFVHPFVAFFA